MRLKGGIARQRRVADGIGLLSFRYEIYNSAGWVVRPALVSYITRQGELYNSPCRVIKFVLMFL